MRPNVLLVVLDTARADALEPYGASRGTTPAFTDLARRGRAVEQAYAPCCWTVPSHASLFTGLLPRAAGLAQIPGGQRHLCKPRMRAVEHRNLPGVLSQAGYHCRGVTANVWVSESSGFADGFDTFEEVGSKRRGRMAEPGLKARLSWALEAFVARADDGASAAADALDRWAGELKGGANRPFFWFVNLMECHSPYLPPKPHTRLNAVQRVLAAEDARRYLTFHEIAKACLGLVDVPEAALERMRVLYQDAVTVMDRWLARVLETLDGCGALDDTQVIVTSDHGENLGEQGLIGHALSLDQRLIRIPFVTAGPAPLELDPLISLTDVPRILGDGLGIKDHPWSEDRTDGVAIAQFDPAGNRDTPGMELLDAWGATDESWRRMLSPITCATDGRWKLVRTGDLEQVFDLVADPLEERAVTSGALPEIVTRLRGAVEGALMGQPLPVEAVTDSGPEPEVSADDADELEKQMRLLGYL